MIEKKIAEFGNWQSPISASLIFQGRQTASNPIPWRDGVLYLLTMPEEDNALALMYTSGTDVSIRVSPQGFSLRSRVHEYGGLPFGCSDQDIYFCNFKDQQIYRQGFNSETESFDAPVQITAFASNEVRYAEIIVDEKRHRLICVREDHRQANGNASVVKNTLVAIPLAGLSLPVAVDAQIVLFENSDFVTSPTLSHDSKNISFVTWSHPNMPWDNTQMRVALFAESGELERLIEVDAGQASSKVQPSFDTDNTLYFLSDFGDYWNLVKAQIETIRSNLVSSPVYKIDADCCGAQWETGKYNYAITSNRVLLISVVREAHWQLHRVNLADHQVEVLKRDLGLLEQIRIGRQDRVTYLAAASDDYPSIYRIAPPLNETEEEISVLFRAAVPAELNASLLSRPRHFQFDSHDGAIAFALLYPPKNPEFTGPLGELPPLLVNVHGGPTGTARAALNPMHQFWTSRGFAVLDLNHRGSTGYGRRFRQLLNGQWGVVDIEDVVAAVKYLIANEQVAPGKIAIRGGSAGGYAVLASLASCDLFAAGANYYGVSDLELLARDTHKFESRYLDQLIGPYPATQERYKARSPINKLDKITAPVLILQGAQDKVVPPNQAELINERLSAQNPATEFILFEGEGHGFRLPANQVRALNTELRFYQRNLLGVSDS
ncbi:MAG: alpha/beta hydrolase family protein [Gammaproteobacteria bacterium]